MRYFLFYSVALMLLTACGEDGAQKQTAGTNVQQAQPMKQGAGEFQETPSSISGSERHLGPNPHAQLSSEQNIAVALQHASEGRMGKRWMC